MTLDIKKILVPTDFSANAVPALDWATDMAALTGAEVVLAHVIESPIYPFGFGVGSLPDVERELAKSAGRELEKIAEERRGKGVEIRTLLCHGQVYHELIRQVREQEIDLVVISTHGHTGLKHAMLGSVAEKVVRVSTCPVTVVSARSA